MNRKDLFNILNYAKYFAFVAATVCILVFQFIAESVCITLALSLYVVAFGLMFASSLMHSIEIYKADKYVKQNHAQVKALVEVSEQTIGKQGDIEDVNLKSEKVWSILSAVFFGCFTIFTLVVLVLF